MLTVINGNNIKYTKGDTFELTVSADTEFNDGSQLRLIIAKDEYSGDLIVRTYALSEGKFTVTLETTERNQLEIGSYLYKLTLLTPEGKILTQQSGELIVEWGV